MQQLTYINLRGERAVFGRGAPYLLRSVRGVGAVSYTHLTLPTKA